ncbi:MAG: hypothetical protein KJ592_04250 [Nanoarchaeota archaeon]|nr:hypothetical protein [Nanoarchaeota archaeon]
MKLSELLSDLKEKESYKNFKLENPEAFFCSAMFILGDADKIDLNFFLPNKNQISSFSMPFASLTNHQEEIKDQKEIKDLNLKVDSDNLTEYIKDKAKKKFPKLIAVLHDGNWNVTCLNGLDMSRIKINAYTGKLEKKDEGSLMDMIKIRKTSEQ